MKKALSILFFICATTTMICGCGNGSASSSKDSLVENLSAISSNTIEDVTNEFPTLLAESEFPKPNAEEQQILDNYFYPYAVTGLYYVSFSPTNMNELENTIGPLFTTLVDTTGKPEGYPTEADLEKNGYQIPAQVFESVIKQHFNLTTEEIQKFSGSQYHADTNTYDLAEIGGGPREMIIVSHEQKDDLLTFSYILYGPAEEQPEDGSDFYYQSSSHGTMVIDLSNNSFKFISNEGTPS